MFRRALLGFIPAVLALAFLCGTPAASGAAPESMASSWKADAAWSLFARGNATQDISDISISPSADQDDSPDDRVVRLVTTIIWPQSAFSARPALRDDLAGPTHRPCAAPPRAPPSA
jgi:hypothetical protein